MRSRVRHSPQDHGRPGCGRTERGSTTAETAVVIPVLALLVLVLCWLVTVGIAQVTVIDAARDGARAAARGEALAAIREHVARTAPEGAAVDVDSQGGLVTVHVTAEVRAPDWLLVPLPAVTLQARSTVESEELTEAQGSTDSTGAQRSEELTDALGSDGITHAQASEELAHARP